MRSAMSDDMHTTPAPAPEVIKSITDALATWDSRDGGRIGQAEDLRQQFIEQFPIRSWPELPLESYALGQQTDGGTVCWWMEWKTKPIASMSGGSAAKHLIYLRKKGQTWRYPKEYASVGDAWAAVRSGFVEALALAAAGEFDEADDINALRGAHALRTKLLYVYFPNDLLPVTSKAHVDHFLERLGQPASSWSVIRANRQLLTALRSIPALQPLSTLQLGFFLYHWAAPRTSVRVFKIAPGELAAKWRDCLQGGFICIGWDLVGDLSDYDSKESFREAFREQYPYNGNEAQVSRKANELWTLMELEAGDKVIANRGTSDVLAIGTVNDDGYAWRPERNEYRHTLGVDWDTSFARKIEPVKAWATTTVSKVSAALFKKISVEGGGDGIERSHQSRSRSIPSTPSWSKHCAAAARPSSTGRPALGRPIPPAERPFGSSTAGSPTPMLRPCSATTTLLQNANARSAQAPRRRSGCGSWSPTRCSGPGRSSSKAAPSTTDSGDCNGTSREPGPATS